MTQKMKKSTLLALGFCIAAFPLLSGGTASAANIFTDGDFSVNSALVTTPANPGGSTFDEVYANANLGKWIAKATNSRWQIDNTNDWVEGSQDRSLRDQRRHHGRRRSVPDPPGQARA